MDVSRPKTLAWRIALGSYRVRGLVAGVVLATGVTTAAVAQPPARPARAATLLPPVQFEPGGGPSVARGAIGDATDPPYGSTPVVRKANKIPASSGPAWLTGVGADANVVPAGGVAPAKSGIAATLPPHAAPARATPLIAPPAETPEPMRAPERSKVFSFFTPRAGSTPPAADQRRPQDGTAPIPGVTPNGAPLLAGPPANRWYGYGAPTPGANPYAPSGQPPAASAAWLAATGATPGAFPIPVMNPYRPAPGSEPPTYVTTPGGRNPVQPEPVVVHTPASASFTQTRVPAPVAPPRFNPPPAPPASVPRSEPAPPVSQMPRLMPVPTQPPTPVDAAPGGVAKLPDVAPPVGVPAIAPLPTVSPVVPVPSMVPPAPVAVVPTPTPVVAESNVPPVVPVVAPPEVVPIVTAKPAPVPESPVTPAPLPASVKNEVQWQANPEGGVPAPTGTWAPAAPRKVEQPGGESGWQPGATNTAHRPVVARAQAPDTDRQADPVADLIRAVCRGRAEGVEVRYGGAKKLMVCFEVRTEPEAARLVKDVSARPELAPYRIDFCVLVK